MISARYDRDYKPEFNDLTNFESKMLALTTFMVDTSLQKAEMSRVSPDSCFSRNVDIFLKKIIEKY